MDLAIYTIRSAAYAIVDPGYATILLILGLVLYFQNRKTSVMQKVIIGESLNSPLELTISQVVLGIFGGVLGSILLTYAGVMFDENSGIELIFLASIFLTMFKPRFICFSYSGALIGLISLLMNDVANYVLGRPILEGFFRIDITALMTLVGVLHIIEGLLIMIDGDRGAIPVFTNSKGKISGGFAFKRYWPIPVVIILLTATSSGGGGEFISTPNWWPLILNSYSAEFLKTAVMVGAPIYAMLGYNAVTFTKYKKAKVISSGLGILLYGIALSAVAQLASFNTILKFFVVAFAPIAHELALRIQSYSEVNKRAKFVSDGIGIMVLEVAPSSPAATMKIKTGDRLLQINNIVIDDENDVVDGIKETVDKISVKIQRADGEEKVLNYNNFIVGQRLGVVFVPKNVPKESLVMGYEESNFKDIFNKVYKDKDKDKKDDEDHNNEE